MTGELSEKSPRLCYAWIESAVGTCGSGPCGWARDRPGFCHSGGGTSASRLKCRKKRGQLQAVSRARGLQDAWTHGTGTMREPWETILLLDRTSEARTSNYG